MENNKKIGITVGDCIENFIIENKLNKNEVCTTLGIDLDFLDENISKSSLVAKQIYDKLLKFYSKESKVAIDKERLPTKSRDFMDSPGSISTKINKILTRGIKSESNANSFNSLSVQDIILIEIKSANLTIKDVAKGMHISVEQLCKIINTRAVLDLSNQLKVLVFLNPLKYKDKYTDYRAMKDAFKCKK